MKVTGSQSVNALLLLLAIGIMGASIIHYPDLRPDLRSAHDFFVADLVCDLVSDQNGTMDAHAEGGYWNSHAQHQGSCSMDVTLHSHLERRSGHYICRRRRIAHHFLKINLLHE